MPVISKIRQLWYHITHYSTWKAHWIPYSLGQLSVAVVFLILDFLGGMVGFMLLEGYSLIDAFYQTAITLSTVGFTEAKPFSPRGKIFVSVYILVNIGIFAYLLSVFSHYVIQGAIFRDMHLNHIQRSIEQLSNHVIVCGFGRYGKEISHHFLKHAIDFVVLENDPLRVEMIQKAEENVLYLEEDATQDESLLLAGITRAKSLITALPDDSDNLFIVLTARQLNPAINIISRATDPKSQRKLRLAGANHVVMPEQIGGFYMSTLVTQPGAVEFFSLITNEYRSDIGFEELEYAQVPAAIRGQSIGNLRIRQSTGANIIGFRNAQGAYLVNPSPQTTLGPGTSFIVLGDRKQLAALRAYLQNFSQNA